MVFEYFLFAFEPIDLLFAFEPIDCEDDYDENGVTESKTFFVYSNYRVLSGNRVLCKHLLKFIRLLIKSRNVIITLCVSVVTVSYRI